LSDIDHRRGLMREVHQPCRKFLWQRMISAECRPQGIERAIKLLCCGELGSPVVGKCSNGVTCQA
jgi:hypothetical protein